MINIQSSFHFKQEDQANPLDHLRKMFIGGLSPATTEESLRNFYSQWGDVVDCIVLRDPVTKRSRGFGFISYSDPTMVDKAQSARPHVIDGKSVDPKRALPRPEAAKLEAGSSVKKIFVGGLKEGHDEQCLSEHFSQFGNVVSVKILTDKVTGRKRGFAFVEFDDYDAVDKAVLQKNHTIKYVLVEVKKSNYKQELAKKLASQQGSIIINPAGGVSAAAAAAAAAHQQPIAAYNTPAYGYSIAGTPQVAPQPSAYNGWGTYPPTAYQTTAPNGTATSPYSAYGTIPQAGAAAAQAWNAAAGYQAQATPWTQNGYGTATVNAAAAAMPAAGNGSGANSWNGGGVGGPTPAFGSYQQSYNGGPQKAGNLQGNRMNPYTVTTATGYANSVPRNYYYKSNATIADTSSRNNTNVTVQ